MSGIAGGNRINKKEVDKTFNSYIENVLKHIKGFQSAKLSGSAKIKSKEDYGDLDIIVRFEGTDKQEVKRNIIDYVSKSPDDMLVPFPSGRAKGKKYYNAGELISVLYPIQGSEEAIQIDNIISLSEKEYGFKGEFLDLPAEKQGLLIGLAKIILLEKKPEQVFSLFGIKTIPKLKQDQEYEFNISTVKLTLRLVTLKDGRDVKHEDIWETTDWEVVNKLFGEYGLDKSFDEMLDIMNKKIQNPRSRRRIPGTFQSLVTVKSGEVGTPKGDNKIQATNKVKKTFAESFFEHYFFESVGKSIGLYAGGFKPPHKGHFHIAQQLSKEVDEIIIFIGHKIREGEIELNNQQSEDIWKIYASYIDKPIKFVKSHITPVKDVYDWVDNNQNDYDKIIIGASIEDERKYSYFHQHKEKYQKIEVKKYGFKKENDSDKVSATDIRMNMNYLRSMKWVPDELTKEDKKEIINIIGI